MEREDDWDWDQILISLWECYIHKRAMILVEEHLKQ